MAFASGDAFMKRMAWTRPAIVLAVAASVCATSRCQNAPNLEAIVKTFSAQIPGLPAPRIYVSGTQAQATYDIPESPERVPTQFIIQITQCASRDEAEQAAQKSVQLTQLAPTSTWISNHDHVSVYEWDTYRGREFHRITSRAGRYVVTVSGSSGSDVSKAYGLLVKQLENQ